MATTRAQRIGIWVIAGVLAVGTMGGFLISILQEKNNKTDLQTLASKQARFDELQKEYKVQYDAYQAKVDAQADELSAQYFDEFNQYSNRPKSFTASNITEVKSEDLKVGTGEEIKADSSYAAYYIGWNPAGKVFDQSIDGTKLKAPLSVTPGGVIQGWTEAVTGMKIGGVREISIPSEKAYGASGSGEDIPPNTPIKFIVMIIPTPEVIAQPQPSEELLKLYTEIQQR